MRVSIIGSGWVGENTGKGFRALGHDVVFHDISKEKIKELEEEGLEATTDLEWTVQNSGVSFISVPTPTRDGGINLDYLKRTVKEVGSVLESKDDYHVVTVKSTVVPTTTEELVIPILEEESEKKVGGKIGVCMNPEFMTEISDTWTDEERFVKGFSSDRVVIGEFDEDSGDRVEELYEDLDVPIIRTDLKTAEMIKYACNCILSTKISYWNEIFQICEDLDIDSYLVAEAAAMDPRIGKYGTVHGKAFGGKCLPKDLSAFIDFVEKNVDHDPELLKAVKNLNEFMAEEYGVRE